MNLSPWNYWQPDGSPRPGTAEMVSTLEGILRGNPNHIGACHFYIPRPIFALARFGKWDDLLREPAPPADFKYTRAIWHYGRGRAFAALHQVDQAAAELDSVTTIRAAIKGAPLASKPPTSCSASIPPARSPSCGRPSDWRMASPTTNHPPGTILCATRSSPCSSRHGVRQKQRRCTARISHEIPRMAGHCSGCAGAWRPGEEGGRGEREPTVPHRVGACRRDTCRAALLAAGHESQVIL